MREGSQMKKLFLKTWINPELTAKLVVFLLIRVGTKTIWPTTVLLCISNKQIFAYSVQLQNEPLLM